MASREVEARGGAGDKRLRTGWTTGACATAALGGAYDALLTGRLADAVTITLPKGETPTFPLARVECGEGFAKAAVEKDAGDDPDVTHGALVEVTVRPGKVGSGIAFRAGEGVGTVTRPGLPVPVGEPAINPGPREMMAAVVADLAKAHGATGDVEVTVSIPGGAALAARTMNGRLGIEGGLSVLGTTGVVTPYSCAAWIASIHQGIDVARATGLEHIAGTTGKTSEAAVKELYGLDDIALIEMGDFVGALLTYLRRKPMPRLTIGGGFGKIAKLAAGHMDLHSSRSAVDIARLANDLSALGAPEAVLAKARSAQSAGQVLAAAGNFGPALGDRVAEQALIVARDRLEGSGAPIAVDVVVFDRAGERIGHAGP